MLLLELLAGGGAIASGVDLSGGVGGTGASAVFLHPTKIVLAIAAVISTCLINI